MNMTSKLGVITASMLFTSLSTAETARQLDAHSHGEAALSIVMEGSQIGMFLLSPAANLVGFEHAPKNSEQEEQINNAKELLADWNIAFQLNGGTSCKPVETSVHWSLEEHDDHDDHKEHDEHDEHDDHKEHAEHDDHDEHKEHDEHDEHDDHKEHAEHDEHDDHKEHDEHAEHDDHNDGETHSEFEVEYLVDCEGLDSLESIEVKLFQLFPRIEKINAEAVLSDSQLVQVLTANDNQIQIAK
ncbi:MAG: DUF2796 domain-containing protein [Acidiferrobacterales bacterium]|nr:DUF2796 domain-containing protein [Acidiferrobacterales bacterium]